MANLFGYFGDSFLFIGESRRFASVLFCLCFFSVFFLGSSQFLTVRPLWRLEPKRYDWKHGIKDKA